MPKSKTDEQLATTDAPAVSPADVDTTDVEPVSGGKVRVPQADGEIVLTRRGERRTYRVSDHLVSPRNGVERAELLRNVAGAELA